MHVARILVACTSVVAFTGGAHAGAPMPGMNFHGEAPPTFNCGFDTGTESCDAVNPNSTGPGSTEQIVILLTNIPGGLGNVGASGVQFGLDYSSTGVANAFATHQTCDAGFQSISIGGPNGEFPTDGSGVAIAFGGCVSPLGEDGIIPVVVLLTTDSPAMGTMTAIGDPVKGSLIYTDCDNFTNNLIKVGEYDWKGTSGVVNCGMPPATVEVTWGRIKAEF